MTVAMADKNRMSEQQARDNIDLMLEQAGWKVQSKKKIDFNAGFVGGPNISAHRVAKALGPRCGADLDAALVRLVVLLRGHGREPIESAATAADRRAVSGDAVLRLAADDALAAPPGHQGQPQASPTFDAALGPAGDLPTAQDVCAAPGAPGLPVPASRPGDRAAESRVVLGRDVHPVDARLSLSGRGHGLGEPEGLGLAAVEYARVKLLCRSLRRGARTRSGRPGSLLTLAPPQIRTCGFCRIRLLDRQLRYARRCCTNRD